MEQKNTRIEELIEVLTDRIKSIIEDDSGKEWHLLPELVSTLISLSEFHSLQSGRFHQE